MGEWKAEDMAWCCDYDKNDYIKKGDAVKGLELWIEDEVENIADEMWNRGIEACINEIKHHVPPADVAEVKHSVWRVASTDPDKEYECMRCKEAVGWKYLYCPNCGARMDGKE